MPDRYLGRQIGKYRVIRLLGAGAFAWVYEAIDRDLEIPVALKILRPEFAGQEAAEARFRREAATAARLRHPNIVTVRDVGQSDGASFVAMDLLPLSLARRLELVTRLPEPEVVRLGLDVAAALAIAHAGGIIHRDIKPDNILIGSAGEAVVADFGLARALSSDASLSATNQVMGTPHYFSPEQARGLDLDGRSDLYSLGVTLFRAITGHLPFEGDDWYAVARQHVETPPPAPSSIVPDLSPAFEATLLQLLAKDPNERFSTAIQLADALATLPTAPIARGSMLTPHSSSQTVIDVTPVVPLPPVEAPLWKRTARAAGIAALFVAGVWGVNAQNGFVDRFVARAIGPDSTGLTAGGDTLLGVQPLPASGAPTVDDSAARQQAAALGMPDSPVTSVREPVRPLAPPRATLILSSPDSAALFVDNKFVDNGSYTYEYPAPSQLRVKAIMRGAPPTGCPAAERDTIVRLSRGEVREVKLDVRACVGLDMQVSPPNAKVIFESLDEGGTRIETRADAVPAPLLPTGMYRVVISSLFCQEYKEEKREVSLRAGGAPHVLRARLSCN
ncbi:MAG: serine/threonine-protein kinase [Gemmatimonadota bacterium]